MIIVGIRWKIRDRYGNEIYLTHERWQHIIASINHPEMANYEEHLKTTIQHGRRRQDLLNPQKYRYTMPSSICQQITHTLLQLSSSGFARARMVNLSQTITSSQFTKKGLDEI